MPFTRLGQNATTIQRPPIPFRDMGSLFQNRGIMTNAPIGGANNQAFFRQAPTIDLGFGRVTLPTIDPGIFRQAPTINPGFDRIIPQIIGQRLLRQPTLPIRSSLPLQSKLRALSAQRSRQDPALISRAQGTLNLNRNRLAQILLTMRGIRGYI